jgi:hypothetical protein
VVFIFILSWICAIWLYFVFPFLLEDDDKFPINFRRKMPMKRGHVSAPQNTFIDTIIRKFDSQSMLILFVYLF